MSGEFDDPGAQQNYQPDISLIISSELIMEYQPDYQLNYQPGYQPDSSEVSA